MGRHSELTEKNQIFHFVDIPTTVAEKRAQKTCNDRLPETIQSEAFDQ